MVLFCVVTLCSACNSSSSTNNGSGPDRTGAPGPLAKQGGVFRSAISEPVAIDPGLAREGSGITVTRQLYEGLVTYDRNAELVMRPGVAERWEAKPDCTEWTFHLRRSKFSNGEDVTAESFVRGWTRAADGKAASGVAYHMAGIGGYGELHGSVNAPQSATTFSGLSAPDPQTFVVKLATADCEFDKKTLMSVMSPVPTNAGGADNKVFGEAPVGNGPFMIKPGTKWEHDRSIALVRSDSYYGAKPNIDGIEFTIFPAGGDTYKSFQAGDIDIAGPPPALRPQAEATYKPQGGFIRDDGVTLAYLSTNDAKGPLQDPDARRALSLAIDRDAINKGISQGYVAPATSLIPPALGSYYQAGVCEACRFDPAKAKELATKTGLVGARLAFIYVGAPTIPEAYKEMFQQNLGVLIDLQPISPPEFQARRDKADFDIAASTWGADYPTPDNFLFPLLGTGSADNAAHYQNAAFDALIGQERGEHDASARRKLVQAAEQMAIGRDMALIPTFNVPRIVAFDATKWNGVALDFFGAPTYTTMSLR
jgi:oligopeptide transport system substrate-binding protein